MTQPTIYTPTTDFSEEEADGVAGRSTLRTAAVDTELFNIATTLGQVCTNLAIIQRDDGMLRDLTVNPFNLTAATLALIGSAGFTVSNPIGWLTATSYAARVIVTHGTGTYVSVSAHTSGVFATDLAAGKWVVIFDSSAYVASGVSFTPTGTIAATNVQAAIAEVALESLQKNSNLSDVNNAGTARTNIGLGTGDSPTFAGLAVTGNETVGGNLSVTGGSTVGGLLDISGGTAGQAKFPATQNPSLDANTLDDYSEYTSPSTACTGAITTSATYDITKVGRVVTLQLPSVYGAGVAVASFSLGSVIPAKYRPPVDRFFTCRIRDNAAQPTNAGLITVSTAGVITVFKDLTAAANFTVTASAGLDGKTVTWNV